MNIRTFFLLLLMLPNTAGAQKQGNIWHFGRRCGLDFSSGAPVSVTGGLTGSNLPSDVQEGTAAISDSAGSLLFYTGGETIWNRSHQPMPNGTSLMGGISSTQAAIIIPRPGSSDIFYVFTSDEFQRYSPSGVQRGYRYSVVDMCLNSGLGDVVSGLKNIPLMDSSTEKLCAAQDGAGTGYWVVGHKMFSNVFCAWHLTAAGITDTVLSPIGTMHGVGPGSQTGSAQGQMKFNPAGTKLALAIGNNQPAIVDVFDFDPLTGVVSNACHMTMDSALNKRAYGVEFSPDGSKLYATVAGGTVGCSIYQYEVGAGSCSGIASSRVPVFTTTSANPLSGLQTGPDNKIYVAYKSYYAVRCIQYPDLSGTAAGFDTTAIPLTGAGIQNNYTFPSFIAGYKYHNGLSCPVIPSAISRTERADAIRIAPNPVSGAAILHLPSQIDIDGIRLIISDACGRTIFSAAIVSHETRLDLSALPRGVCFFLLRQHGGVLKAGKFIAE